MVKRSFWESIAEVWSRKEKIVVPSVDDVPDIPEEDLFFDDNLDMDDLLGDIFGDGTTFDDILPKK